MFKVVIKFKPESGYSPSITLEHITEIHYCYPSPLGVKVAFESSVDGTGATYPVGAIAEFEAQEAT